MRHFSGQKSTAHDPLHMVSINTVILADCTILAGKRCRFSSSSLTDAKERPFNCSMQYVLWYINN